MTSDIKHSRQAAIDHLIASDWFSNQPPLTDREKDQFARLLVSVLTDGDELDDNGGASFSLFDSEREDVYSRADVKAVSASLERSVRDGHGSAELLVSWRRHLFAEQHHIPSRASGNAAKVRWKKALPPRLRQILESTELELATSLGRDIAAAVFVGPTTTRLIFGRDSFQEPLELEFLLYHLYLHTLGDLPVEGFGSWLEYKRETTSNHLIPLLSDEQYREHEAVVNDEATCLMYDNYVSGPRLHPLSRSLVRRALKRQVVELKLIRTVLGDRNLLRRLMRLWMWTILASLSHNPWLRRVARPRLQFTEHVAVVREASWKPIYLIWANPDGALWRRWVPSRKVLLALGLRRADVALIGDLSRYRDDGILLEPNDVRQAYLALARASRSVLPLPGVTTALLPGLVKASSSFSLPIGHRENRVSVDVSAEQNENQELTNDPDASQDAYA